MRRKHLPSRASRPVKLVLPAKLGRAYSLSMPVEPGNAGPRSRAGADGAPVALAFLERTMQEEGRRRGKAKSMQPASLCDPQRFDARTESGREPTQFSQWNVQEPNTSHALANRFPHSSLLLSEEDRSEIQKIRKCETRWFQG